MAHSEKLKVFISYSRDDLKFADQLDAALDGTGFDCIIDRHGIHGGEDWKRRLGNLILEADTIVFVLSPSSAASKICEWEVDEAVKLGKRILPVLCRPLDRSEPPQHLRHLNYIYFYDEPKVPGSGFGAGLSALITSLNTDLDWLREHTRLLERANEWVKGGRQESGLLFGSSIADAKTWAERRPKSAPDITPLHLELLRSSEEAEARRTDSEAQRLKAIAAAQEERAKAIVEREDAQKREIEASRSVVRRTMIGLVAASVLALIAGGTGFLAYLKQGEALTAKDAAEAHLRRAAEASSLFRAMQANEALSQDDPVAAAVVAMSGVPDLASTEEFERTRPFHPQAFHALHQAWINLKEKAVLAGHRNAVRAILPSGDGTFLLTISEDGAARLWDAQGAPKRILSGHTNPLTAAAISSDSRTIAIGSADQTVTLWHADGQFKARLSGHKGAVTSIAFSPDDTKVLTASRDREAKLWDMDGNSIAVFSGHTSVVNGAVFSPDGTRILTASDDATAKIWDLSGQHIATLPGHSGAVSAATYSHAGDVIATASEDTSARLWTAAGEHKTTFVAPVGPGPLTFVAFSPDGTVLLVGTRQSFNVWHVPTGQMIGGGDAAVVSTFAPSGLFATASRDGTTSVWSYPRYPIGAQPPIQIGVFKGHDGAVTRAAFATDGASLLTASNDGTARIWDMAPSRAATIDSDRGDILELVFAADAPYLVSRHADDDLAVIWDTEGKKLAELKKNAMPSTLTDAQIAANGQHVLTAYGNGEAIVWSRNGKEIMTLSGGAGSRNYLAPSGEFVLTLSASTGTLWDLKKNKIATLALGARAEWAQIAADGSRIAIVTDKAIEVWSPAGERIGTFAEESRPDLTLISPDATQALRAFKASGEDPNGSSVIVDLKPDGKKSLLDYAMTSAAYFDRTWLAVLRDGSARVIGSDHSSRSADPSLRLSGAVAGSNTSKRALALAQSDGATVVDRSGLAVLSVPDATFAAMSPDGERLATISGSRAHLWSAFPNPQVLVDRIKAELPRCLSTGRAQQLHLEARPTVWCMDKHPNSGTAGVAVETVTAPRDPSSPAPAVDFAYYPPGDLPHQPEGTGRPDRTVYLPDIAFPLKLGPGEHAFMNSQIWGYGGGGWGGKGMKGGSQCDPRNYDSMRQRDTYCEIRAWDMPLCPSGKGKQGQSIRPPTCETNRWEVIAVADGTIINATSNTTVTLLATDGTEFTYLHMMPQSLRVKAGQKVRKGDVIGKVGNILGGRPATSIQLTFNAKQEMSIGGSKKKIFVPVYSSLIAAYRELKGLDRGIDANGKLIVDPNHEIGAGILPRPPD